MVTMPAMERHAFKAVAMVRALLLTGTVIPALPDLLQKLLLDLPCLLLLPTAIKIVLQNGQLISVDFHNRFPLLLIYSFARVK